MNNMTFSKVVLYLEKIEKISSKNEITHILSELFKEVNYEEIDKLIYLLQGSVLPSFKGIEFNLSEKSIIDVLVKLLGIKKNKIQDMIKEKGDLGNVVYELIKWNGKDLTISQIYNKLYFITQLKGTTDKILNLVLLFKNLSNLEIKYVIRIITGRMRLGFSDAIILDALSLSLGNKNYRSIIENAYNLCSDLGLIGKKIKENNNIKDLENFKIQIGYPIRMMLAERVSNIDDIVKRLGKSCIEVKYDGFRLQVHKENDKVEIYSRNLERITYMFPDIVEDIKNNLKINKIIFEGEVIAIDENTNEFYPFQIILQRKRKYDIESYIKEYPVKLFCFDLLYYDNEEYINKSFIERRKKLEEIISNSNSKILTLSEMIITEDKKEIERFFNESISKGLEGIMAKRIDGVYNAGIRSYSWIKFKKNYQSSLSDTIDVVILGYDYGKGLRSNLGIGAILVGIYDKNEDKFKTISKVGSGLSEENWIKLKDLLDKIKISKKHDKVESLINPDIWVEPKYVISIIGDEITKSEIHTSGFGIRFPRVIGFIREDKGIYDVDNLEDIKKMIKS